MALGTIRVVLTDLLPVRVNKLYILYEFRSTRANASQFAEYNSRVISAEKKMLFSHLLCDVGNAIRVPTIQQQRRTTQFYEIDISPIASAAPVSMCHSVKNIYSRFFTAFGKICQSC
jgi:hypothetical protein